MKKAKTETKRKAGRPKKVISPIAKRKSVKRKVVLNEAVETSTSNEVKSVVDKVKQFVDRLVAKIKSLL